MTCGLELALKHFRLKKKKKWREGGDILITEFGWYVYESSL